MTQTGSGITVGRRWYNAGSPPGALQADVRQNGHAGAGLIEIGTTGIRNGCSFFFPLCKKMHTRGGRLLLQSL
jgi:hypothetical protein